MDVATQDREIGGDHKNLLEIIEHAWNNPLEEWIKFEQLIEREGIKPKSSQKKMFKKVLFFT